MSRKALARRIAQAFQIPMQVAFFFALLICFDVVPQEVTDEELGMVENKSLAYRLRRSIKKSRPEIQVYSQNRVGYWLDAPTRHNLRVEFGIEQGIDKCA